MELLTDGSERNPVLGFCLAIVSKYGSNWPPSEPILAHEFVHWAGFSSFLSRDALKELCRSKGVSLSFQSLPKDIRGFNCTYQNSREIVVTDLGTAPFSEVHTLFHEFREMLEHIFGELGYPTLKPTDSLEEHAEHFAVDCRMKTLERELPTFIDLATNAERKWVRYLGYGLVGVFAAAYLFACVFMPQMEEMASEIESQRYVRT